MTTLKQERCHLRKLVTIDPLTGVCNRDGFEFWLQREWKRAKQENSPISLLLVDIDHFKRLNDEHGLQVGDRILMRLAFVLRTVARRSGDLFARHGGEEFALILPDTSNSGAVSLAERVLKRARLCGVTVSIGVATMQPGEDDIAAFMTTAVKNLDKAKRDGRDRYIFEPTTGEQTLE